jgi:PHD/YefM family antitoxin component YafN of YafNO toxin-antitoxin module
MTRMSIKKALNDIDDLIEKKIDEKERIGLTRGGKTVAVVVSVEDFKKLCNLEKEELEDLRDAKKELIDWKRDRKSIPWEQIKRENNL